MARSDKQDKLALIKRTTRRRFAFTLVTLLLYFSFALNWTEFGAGMSTGIGTTSITGAMLMFALLIVTFVALEYLFLRVTGVSLRKQDNDGAQ